jgi:putative peptidoglycan lipid II flippase
MECSVRFCAKVSRYNGYTGRANSHAIDRRKYSTVQDFRDRAMIKSGFPSPILLFCLGVIYAIVMALAFQKLMLPLMPALHAKYGLLQKDAIYFHDLAVAMADKIRSVGWSEWHLYPGIGATGNVALLGALYAVLGPDPVWFIPFTAAAHAFSAMMIYRMGSLLWPGKAGLLGGMLAALFFLASPSALQWYGQNHKDAFAIAGCLLILHAWIRLWAADKVVNGLVIKTVLGIIGGAVVVLLIRQYLLYLISAGMLAGWSAIFLRRLIQRQVFPDRVRLSLAMLAISLVFGVSVLNPGLDSPNSPTSLTSFIKAIPEIRWHRSEFLPLEIDKLLGRVSAVRAHFAHSGKDAGSIIDANQLPDNAVSVFAYLPRALLVGLFAPFPNSWQERPTLIRVVAAAETLIWYLLVPGVILLIVSRPSDSLFAGLAFAATLLTVLSFAQPVVGTLYRERFGIWMFVALTGAVGWSHHIIKILSDAGRCAAITVREMREGARVYKTAIPDVAASGAIVLLMGFITVIGFVLRDLLLVNSFGMNARLGAYFSATMIPMFFVLFLSLPMSDAMTSRFLTLDLARRRRFVQNALCIACMILPILRLVMSSADHNELEQAVAMLRWFAPILMFSGWTVIGNAVLNMNQQSRNAALSQLIVPVVACITILLLQNTLGLYAAIFGMLAGFTMNIAIVVYLVRRLEINLVPSFSDMGSNAHNLAAMYRNHLALASAALFMAATMPLNYAFAGSFDLASVSVWAFGSKIVQLSTTTAGVVVGAVILPHLGHLVARRKARQMEDDFFFLLISGTWISFIFVLGIQLFSEPIVMSMLQGGDVSENHAKQLAEILQLSALQLPFVIATTLVLKLAAVSKLSWRIVIATSIGFVINLLGNLLFTGDLGVHGIAISATAGVAGASGLLIIWNRKSAGLDLEKLFVLFGTWSALAGLSIAVQWRSFSTLALAVIAVSFLIYMHWNFVLRRRRELIPEDT